MCVCVVNTCVWANQVCGRSSVWVEEELDHMEASSALSLSAC